MHAEIYQHAVERMTLLRRELTVLETFVREYGALSECDGREVAPSPLTRSRMRATPQADLETIVLDIIREVGRPLQRAELFTLAQQRGVVIAGTKQIINFGSKLSRAAGLVNLSKLGYWPKDEPYEPGNYHPAAVLEVV